MELPSKEMRLGWAFFTLEPASLLARRHLKGRQVRLRESKRLAAVSYVNQQGCFYQENGLS